jgi:hypothetical protein
MTEQVVQRVTIMAYPRRWAPSKGFDSLVHIAAGNDTGQAVHAAPNITWRTAYA